MKQKKILTACLLAVIVSLCAIFSFLKYLGEDLLLAGAAGKLNTNLPAFVYQFYIQSISPVNPNGVTKYGFTPLTIVISSCDKMLDEDRNCNKTIKYLLARGANVNALNQDALGLAPLHLAILHGDSTLAHLLLEKGANPNVQASGKKFQGMTPLKFAKEFQNSLHPEGLVKTTELLVKAGGHE